MTIRLFAGVGKGPAGEKLPPVEIPSAGHVGDDVIVVETRPAPGPVDSPASKSKSKSKGR